MSLHRNRVQMTVTGAPGTGTITLNAATTGYQSFSSAYGADATVDILITDGNNWEVCRNCAYTNATPQVDRGTLEGSSAGPTTRVSFTSAAIVSVIATAATGNNWGLNEIQASPTGAGVTGVVGTMHILDISGLTASQDFTLPATCAVGDRVGVFIKVGDADHALLLKPASGDTINGGSPAAEWSRVFATGDLVIFRCIAADSEWIVEVDGLQRLFARAKGSASNQTISSLSTFTKVTCLVTDVSDGAVWDDTNKVMKLRRPGRWLINGGFRIDRINDTNRMIMRIGVDTSGGGTLSSSNAQSWDLFRGYSSVANGFVGGAGGAVVVANGTLSVGLLAFQDSSVIAAVQAEANLCFLSAMFLGPAP